MKNKKKIRYLLSFFLIVALDQITKFFIRDNFVLNSSRQIGFFSLTYVQNTGASFGMFKGYNWLFIIVSIAVLSYLVWLYLKEKKYGWQFSLICAGIIGNLIDRVFLGYVVDFIDLGWWPIFNIADSSISIGAVWLIYDTMKKD